MHELQNFSNHLETYKQYCHDTTVDIGCGNGKKTLYLLKKLAEKDPSHKRHHLGIDGSAGAVKLAKENAYTMAIPGVEADFALGDFTNYQHEGTQAKTFFSVGGGFADLDEEQQASFLEQCHSSMQPWDNLIINTFVEEVSSPQRVDISNEELVRLQKAFVKTERERFNRENRWDREKEIDIAALKQQGVDVKKEDLEYDMFFDRDTSRLIDVKTAKKNLYVGNELVRPKWETVLTEGTLLDKNFFLASEKEFYKGLVESTYIAEDSNAFIYHFLKRFGINDNNSLIKYEYRDSSLNISLVFTEDAYLYIFDTPLHVKQGEIFTILNSRRQPDTKLIEKFQHSGFSVKEDIPIEVKNAYFHDLKATIMRSYILQKDPQKELKE